MKSHFLIIINFLILYSLLGFSVNITECQNITNSGYFVLTSDLTGTQNNYNVCININASDVILDCNAKSIIGNNEGKGIFSISKNNITIKNCLISNYEDGIELISTSNALIINNSILNNNDDGLDLDMSSSFINATQNTFYNNSYGVVLTNVENSNIFNNTFILNINASVAIYSNSETNYIFSNDISSSIIGIGTWLVNSNQIYENFITNTSIGIFSLTSNLSLISENNISNSIIGIYLNESYNNIFDNNFISNTNSYGIYFYNSSNNFIINSTVSNCSYGIYLTGTNYNFVENNTVSNTISDAISAYDSYNLVIKNNIISNIDSYGIYFDNIYNSSIENNFIFNTDGISIDDSKNNNITFNEIKNSYYGIAVSATENNKITKNYIYNTSSGIDITGSAKNELVTENIILNSNIGINLDSGSDCLIYNNFFNNTKNVNIGGTSSSSWNTTKAPGTNIVGGNYLAGNFWATPDGTGFSENITACNPGEDGICKNAYVMNENNTDYHPLTLINLKVSDLTYTPSNPYTSDKVTISAKILSNSISGNIKIQVYDNNNLIYTISPYSVSPGENSLTINLGYLTSGTHTIKLVIDPDNAYPEVNENDNEISTEIYVVSRFIPSSSTYYSSSSDSSISAGTNKISPGQSITYNFSLPKLDITDIILTFANSASGISINVNQLLEPPTGIITPSGKVYAYITIDKTNFKDSDISSVTIKFRIPISWLNENNIDENSIKLYKYENGEWKELPTSILSRDDKYIYYSATSQGLSIYSISGQVKTITAPSEEKPTAPTEEKPAEKPADYTWIIIIGVIIVIAVIAYFFISKKKK
ncbi:MAG: NosD domain-containing protein [Candidatus Aenigmatarchaeota archaeon]